MIDQDGNYDLYWFDQTQALEWQNYKQGEGFRLVSGMGYLYANKDDVTLTFSGMPYDGDGTVSLVKDQEAYFSGWNLVGNPFNETAYIDRPFYRMNASGTEINSEAETGGIEKMEGVFVIAEEDGESLTFSTTMPETKSARLDLNLSNGRGVIDRAIIRFDEGRTLPKFQLRNNSTKLYIPQDNTDYAVVNAESIGELPISFKASENGVYTLTVSETFHSPLSTLHLIDNLTGTDTDLLATPSYTFEAKTTDYANRFRLVFSTEDADNSDQFAFFSDGKLIVLHEGDATLEVMDAAGRVLHTQTIQGGCTETSMPYAPGVYVIRVTTNQRVQTQKMLIK